MYRTRVRYIVLIAIVTVVAAVAGSSTGLADVDFDTPTIVSIGMAPSVAVSADHSLHLVFHLPDTRIIYGVKPQGAPWVIEPPFTNGSEPEIAVSPQGVLHHVAVFDGAVLYLDRPPNTFWPAAEFNLSMGTAAESPDVVTGPNGEVHAVWAEGGEIYARTRAAYHNYETWGSIVNLSNTPSTASQDPAIATTSDGTAYAVWAEGPAPGANVFYASKPHKGTWAAPIEVCCSAGPPPPTTAAYPDVAVGPAFMGVGPDIVWVAYCQVTAGVNDPCFYKDLLTGVQNPISKTPADAIRVRVAGAILDSATDGPHAVWEQTPGTGFWLGCVVEVQPEICYHDGPLSSLKLPLAVSNSPAVPSEYPSIGSFDDGAVYVMWQEFLTPTWHVSLAESPAADDDSDGMSDLYEQPRSCLNESVHDSGADPDSDGLTSLAEFQAGTEPCVNDTDQDGCADGEELGPLAGLGGQRNPLNFWDFYDVPAGVPLDRDQRVNIIDVSAVANHFGTVGDPNIDPLSAPPATGYHTAYDRGGPMGPDLWNLRPANGAIDIIDIGSVVAQFGHTCVAAP